MRKEAYRFLHILIQDAANNALLRRTRAELHEAFADWLERVAFDHLKEYEEIRVPPGTGPASRSKTRPQQGNIVSAARARERPDDLGDDELDAGL